MDSMDFLTLLCISAIKLYAYVFMVACMEWTSNGKFPAPNYMSYDDVWKVGLQLHQFLTLALDGGGWSASCPGHLTPVE